MARINRTFVLTLLIAASTIFLLIQLFNYRQYSSKFPLLYSVDYCI
uniref:Ribitol-5-phosphate transferase FKTN N-terminal domain-containing protein n=1 Tax=Sinocyclocheilus rhinocerous TaxID=307959 RepID=A0A673KUA5_9TELE